MTSGAPTGSDPFIDPQSDAGGQPGSTLICARDVTLTLGSDSLVILGQHEAP